MGYEPTTIISEVDKGLEKHAQDVFIATKREGQWIETGNEEFRDKVKKLALGLYDLGVRKGDKVSLHSENSAEWLMCDQAILSLGAATVPIYTTQPPEQIRYILEKSDSKIYIFSNDELYNDARSAIKEIDSIEHTITILGSEYDDPMTFEEILEKGAELLKDKPDLLDTLKAEVEPDDLATLIYTSGTTGNPKGVMLTHNNIGSNVLASLERVPFDETVREDERMLSYLPLSHVFERLITYMYIRMGYPIYYIESIDKIRDDFQYVKPYYFATVPRLIEKLHTGIKVKGQDFSGIKKQIYYWAIKRAEEYDPENPPKLLGAIKHKIADKLVYSQIREQFGGKLLGMVSGGAALSPNLFRFMNAIGFICMQGYGLTETSPVISVNDKDHLRVGSSGKPLSNVDVEIADDGEILVQGPNVMRGYYKDEEKTDEVFTEDGWLKTGDIGKLEDGYLFITDRKKSVFKLSTGKYVAPNTIENLLVESGFIDQAVVIGYQRKFCSALIVPDYENVKKRLKNKGKSLSENLSRDSRVQKLIQREVDKVNRNLSPWETVKKFVLLEDPFTIESGELTPTHKVKRRVVQERYKEEIESMYEEESSGEEE